MNVSKALSSYIYNKINFLPMRKYKNKINLKFVVTLINKNVLLLLTLVFLASSVEHTTKNA